MMNPNPNKQPDPERISQAGEGSLDVPMGAESPMENTSEVSESDRQDLPDDSSNPISDSPDDRGKNADRHSSFPIVGIGASAGGLEAFQAFFRHMDENSGMAFVLISHLSPDHDSILSELLSKETQMSVLQVREKTVVEPDRVYVIPPNAHLTIERGILCLSQPAPVRGHRVPIDIFFRSLAEDQGENAICIILSGTGSDGTIGLKSIKEFGGLAIAQDSATAKYDSMPRSAVLTGLVDYVLPVEDMPAKLLEYARHRQGLRESLGEEGILVATADRLNQICSLLRRRLGHDFSGYKTSTLVRRIQRRIQITQFRSVAAYIEYLQSDANEIHLLFKDLLIGVTHFFRDPESFEVLKQKAIAPLVASHRDEASIRVWVTGCSSGEEAYSIAMLLYEELHRQNVQVQVQIFATDIDERALEIARQARYPENIAEQVTPERLERFFIQQSGVYQVTKNLRETCIFSRHSLINDPPFSRIDLISCRNLLIYFDTALQQKLIPLFHYALQPGGYLFLGSSETLTSYGELFRTVNKQHRIFQQTPVMIPPQIDFPLVDRSQYRQLPSRSESRIWQRQQQISRSIERLLLQEYAPPCVIINEQNEAVYFFGHTGKYLEPSQGIPSNNLFDLARRGLGLDLRVAIQSARETRRIAVRERVSIETEDRVQMVNLTVRPIREANEDSQLLMVIFQDVRVATSYERAEAEGSEPREESRVIQQLENELRSTKEHLRSTIEELETSNEELKSANEELLSMNEEFQSSNEELQTSKEEMQSINEELETVNAELRNKIEELDSANSDLQNLFESTRIATVFLDRHLRIKKFTPAATRLFSFIETDIGRPITDITLALADVDIAIDVREVLRSLIPIEREVGVKGQEIYYKMRVLPYRTLENAIDGTVITFVDVTDLRRARNQAERSARRQQAISELGIYALQNMDAQAICDRAVHIVCETFESRLCSLFVYPSDDRPHPPSSTDRLLLKSGCGWDAESVGTATVSTVDSFPGYTLRVQKPVIVEDFSQETRFSQSALLSNANVTGGLSAVVYGSDGSYGVLAIYSTEACKFTPDDISFLQAIANGLAAGLQREKAMQAVAKNRERLDLALNAGRMGVWELDIATGLATWNEIEYELLGLTPDEVETPSAKIFFSYVYPDDVSGVRRKLEEVTDGRRAEFDVEFRINRADGQVRWLAGHGKTICDAAGNVVKVIGVNYDITEQKQNEAALQGADRRKNEFLALLGHELRNPLNAIIHSLGLMRDLEDRDRQAQLYATADRQLQQLARLIDDLLDVSRIVYGKIRLRSQPMNFTQLLSDLVEDIRESVAKKALTLETHLPAEPVWVEGDRIRLTQAFFNVLKNAINFSNSGDRIEISATPNEGSIAVKITDTGIGMEPEALSRIFTAFSQEDRSLARSGGLGLGLPLSQGIIELHNGRISANSPGIGRGTEVTIELPVIPEPSETAANSPTATEPEIAPGEEPVDVDRAIRVLVIEDNEDFTPILEFFLKDAGYEVALADNGLRGLELARQFRPDVILSDIGLTRAMDGYEVARAIRADPELSGIYTIAISGYGQPEDKAQAQAAGFDAHLTKPLDLRELNQAIVDSVRTK